MAKSNEDSDKIRMEESVFQVYIPLKVINAITLEHTGRNISKFRLDDADIDDDELVLTFTQ